MNDTRRPLPEPLHYITPTQLADGADCPLRLGFSRDPAVSWLSRSSAASALGSAAHEVVSKLGVPGDFETVWNQAVSHAHASLIQDWAPAAPPSPENWPGWSLTKVRMRKAWEHNTAQPTHRASTPAHLRPKGGQPPQLPWRERWLRHPHLGLAGRPDLVERIDGQVWVVDLKTGLKQDEPMPAQRTQLLFYCALVQAALGQLPTYAAAQTTRGERHSFGVNACEAQDVTAAASSMLERMNNLGPEGLNETMASPSAAACGWFPFRPACAPFFDAYGETWPIPHALLFDVRLRAHLPRSANAVASRLLGFPFAPTPHVGDLWGAINFAGRSSSAIAGWNTTVFRWE